MPKVPDGFTRLTVYCLGTRLPTFAALIVLASACGRKDPGYIPEDMPFETPVPTGDLQKNKEARALLVSQNRELVERAKASMEPSKEYQAAGFAEIPCGQIPYQYRIFKRDQDLVLNQRIALVGPAPADTTPGGSRDALMKEVQGCIEPMRAKMMSYGISLEIEFRWKDEADTWVGDRTVSLVKGPGRSHAYEWRDNVRSSCSTVLHEIGHLMGLPDEYHEEGTCRESKYQAPEVYPVPLMRNSWDETSELYPRNILQLLSQALPSRVEMKLVSPKEPHLLKAEINSVLADDSTLKVDFDFGNADLLVPLNLEAGTTFIFMESSRSELFVKSRFTESKLFSVNQGWVKATVTLSGSETKLEFFGDHIQRLSQFFELTIEPFKVDDYSRFPTLQFQADNALDASTISADPGK